MTHEAVWKRQNSRLRLFCGFLDWLALESAAVAVCGHFRRLGRPGKGKPRGAQRQAPVPRIGPRMIQFRQDR
jgi:hypothetical protein